MTLDERTAEAAAMPSGYWHISRGLAAAYLGTTFLAAFMGWALAIGLSVADAKFAAQDQAGQEAALGVSYRTAGVALP